MFYPSNQPLYVGPNAHGLYEALQEAVAYTHALHEALQEAVAHTHALHWALQDTAHIPHT